MTVPKCCWLVQCLKHLSHGMHRCFETYLHSSTKLVWPTYTSHIYPVARAIASASTGWRHSNSNRMHSMLFVKCNTTACKEGSHVIPGHNFIGMSRSRCSIGFMQASTSCSKMKQKISPLLQTCTTSACISKLMSCHCLNMSIGDVHLLQWWQHFTDKEGTAIIN